MTASLFYNRVQYTAVSAGTGDFVTSAATTGYRTPAGASIPDGTLVSYVAYNSAQTEWETGQGAYTSGTLTVARTTIRESTNGGSKVNFTAAPTVAVDFQAQDIALLAPLISPSFTTPALGVATATSLAIGGATIGTNALAVTGRVATGEAGVGYTSGITLIGIEGYSTSAGSLARTNSQRNSRLDNNGITWASDYRVSWTSVAANTGSDAGGTPDTQLTRNAAGIIQFGTTAANAAGSWLAATGRLDRNANAGGTLLMVGVSGANFSLDVGTAGTGGMGVQTGSMRLNTTDNSFYFTDGTSWLQMKAASSVGIGFGAISGGTTGFLSLNSAGVLQFGTTTANASGAWLAAKGTLTGGTLADQAQVLAITATQPASPSAEQSAIKFSITSAGSASIFNEGVYLEYKAGYTGNSTSYGIAVDSFVAGTAANSLPSSANTSTGNIGLSGTSLATTVGTNIGQMGFARGGNVNFGLIGIANTNKNSATNIGVAGTGLNGGTSPIQIGGFFTLGQTTVPTVSAALIADNGAQIDAIFLARDNGSTVFTIADGGAVVSTSSITGSSLVSTATIAASTSISLGTANGIVFNGRSIIWSSADGNIRFSDQANATFGLLQLGGTTSSFPAIKRVTTGLEIKLADDSAYSTLKVLGGASFISTGTALTDGVGASAGTITNAPSVGNPTKWIGINDNGTTRYIPAW